MRRGVLWSALMWRADGACLTCTLLMMTMMMMRHEAWRAWFQMYNNCVFARIRMHTHTII